MANQPAPLDDLVLAWQELRRQGRRASPEQLCAGSPELTPALRKKIEVLSAMEAFLDVATGATEAAAPTAAEEGLPPHYLTPPQGPGELGRLGPYRVLRLLGAGGMGLVCEAEDTQLQRPVALKVMRPELAVRAAARRRFVREGRAMAAVEHEHVVSVYQVGEERGVPFLAMPLLRGESLEARLRRDGKLPPAEAVRIGREAAEGLAAAHARGLVHRDIKPANLWLEESGRVKILDFGLARAADRQDALTQTGNVLGTPQYMAPEQAAGDPTDGRCDLFSLGCVLYRMCTGRLPFPGRHVLAVLSALATHQPQAPRQLEPAVPRALSDLIVRLLARDPRQRPASATEVAAALQAIADGKEGGRAGHGRRRSWAAAASAALAGCLLFGVVLSIDTAHGTVKIELSDPRAQVRVKADGEEIRLQHDGGTLRLKVGEHKLEVSGKDFETVAESFTVRRGKQVVLRVTLVPRGKGEAGVADRRRRWIYDCGAGERSYRDLGKKRWAETDPGGKAGFFFKETARTPEYVEITDATGRGYVTRLHRDASYTKGGVHRDVFYGGKFRKQYSGHWADR